MRPMPIYSNGSSIAPKHVFGVSDRFEMIWIDAHFVFAKMINFSAFWNVTFE